MRHDYTDKEAMAVNDRILAAIIERGEAKFGALNAFARASGVNYCVVGEIKAKRTASPSFYQVIRLVRGLGMKIVITADRKEGSA